MAAVAGTTHAALLASAPQQQKMLLALRQPDATSAGLAATTASAVEKRRSDWLTTGNLERWLYGWGQLLLLTGFGVKRLNPATGAMGIYVPKAKRRRIINPDDTHLLLSTELEKNGPRASVYSDPELGAPAREMVVCSRHTSLFLAITAAHEVLAPYFEFDSTAVDDNQTVGAAWVKDLPKPRGFFGNPETKGKQVSRPACEVSAKGGSGKGSFLSFFDKMIAPVYNITPEWVYADGDGDGDGDGGAGSSSDDDESACKEIVEREVISGPVLVKTDSGPDRLDMEESALIERRKRNHAGQLIYPGLPNGSAANQEADQLCLATSNS